MSLRNVVKFNELAGNFKAKRDLTDQDVHLQMELIIEEFTELKTSFIVADDVGVVDSCADLIVVVAGMLHKIGLDPDDVMNAVNKANMSKFCYTYEDAVQSRLAYEGDGRYTDVIIERKEIDQEEVFIIKGCLADNPNGGRKILKGIDFEPPENTLQELLDARTEGEI